MYYFKFSGLFMLVLSLGFFFSSCADGKVSEHAEHAGHDEHVEHAGSGEHAGHDHDTENMEHTSSMDGSEGILQSYLQIKDALVKTDGKAASEAAQGLQAFLEEDQTEIAQKIKLAAEQIAATQDPKVQRIAFNLLSQEVYEFAKGNDQNGATLYKQYCPMAFDNQGAFWLAAEQEINNPYFGEMMLHCGKVEEEI